MSEIRCFRLRRGCLLLAVGLNLMGRPVGAQGTVSVKAQFVPRAEAKEKVAPEPTQLSDIVRIRAEADSGAGVAKVRFEVDDQFRVEVKAPPYTYDWDTLAENDGDHTLSITAYNNNGQTGTKRLKVTVANRLNLGIPHYAKQALEALRRFDEIGVEKAARKAFKISTVNPEAIRVMALNIGIKGDIGRAFQMLDDPQSNIPKADPVTLEIRGVLLLARAFRNANALAMLPDLQAGMALATQRADRVLEEAKTAFPADRANFAGQMTRGDALLGRNQLDDALAAYQQAQKQAQGAEEQRRAKQRVGIVLLRIGRIVEAERLIVPLANGPDGTATSKAVLGAILFAQRKYVPARDVVQEGVVKSNPAALVVATLADLATGARAQAYKEAREAVEAADGPETQYTAQAMLADTGDAEGARKSFVLAAMNAPLSMPILVERAFELMAYDKSEDRFVQALNILDVALGQEPENGAAVAGRIVALMNLKRFTAARPLLRKLAQIEPTSPDLFALLAADLFQDAKQARAVADALAQAKKLDPYNFKYDLVPPLPALVAPIMRVRRTIPLTPSLLDRADALPAASAKTTVFR